MAAKKGKAKSAKAKKSSAAKKAAATKKRNEAKRSESARKAARTRKRNEAKAASAHKPASAKKPAKRKAKAKSKKAKKSGTRKGKSRSTKVTARARVPNVNVRVPVTVTPGRASASRAGKSKGKKKGGKKKSAAKKKKKTGARSARERYAMENPLGGLELFVGGLTLIVGFGTADVVDRFLATHALVDKQAKDANGLELYADNPPTDGSYPGLFNGTAVIAPMDWKRWVAGGGLTFAPMVVAHFIKAPVGRSALQFFGFGVGARVLGKGLVDLIAYLSKKTAFGQRLYVDEMRAMDLKTAKGNFGAMTGTYPASGLGRPQRPGYGCPGCGGTCGGGCGNKTFSPVTQPVMQPPQSFSPPPGRQPVQQPPQRQPEQPPPPPPRSLGAPSSVLQFRSINRIGSNDTSKKRAG